MVTDDYCAKWPLTATCPILFSCACLSCRAQSPWSKKSAKFPGWASKHHSHHFTATVAVLDVSLQHPPTQSTPPSPPVTALEQILSDVVWRQVFPCLQGSIPLGHLLAQGPENAPHNPLGEFPHWLISTCCCRKCTIPSPHDCLPHPIPPPAPQPIYQLAHPPTPYCVITIGKSVTAITSHALVFYVRLQPHYYYSRRHF